jgi:hypothetical protein
VSRTKDLIAGALQVIAGRSRDLRSLTETPRPAGRRHLRGIVSSAVAVVAVITVASVLLATSFIASGPVSASIALRSPLEIRQIASITTAYPCPPGSVTIAAGVCFDLTGTGMTITAVQSTYVRKQSVHAPKGKFPFPTTIFWATIRLASSDAARLLAVTGDVYRLPSAKAS